MPYEFREYPMFSWSHSRRTTFQECPRKYYYHYYASHNGWEATAPEGARLVYRLKNLTSLPLEIGAAIHEAASTAIHAVRSGDNAPTAEMLYSTARNRLNKAWKESQNRPEWERSPKWRRMFHEFYYDTGIGENKIADAKDRIMKCLENLLVSVSFREAIASPTARSRTSRSSSLSTSTARASTPCLTWYIEGATALGWSSIGNQATHKTTMPGKLPCTPCTYANATARKRRTS